VQTLEAGHAQLTPCSRELFLQLYEEFLALGKRLAAYDEKLTAMGQAHPDCQRLQTIPGIGPVRATALLAAVGDATQFKNGRQLAAWLGLVPREHSTGARHGSSGSAHVGTFTSVPCWSTGPGPRSAGSRPSRTTGVDG
jgi:transposase